MPRHFSGCLSSLCVKETTPDFLYCHAAAFLYPVSLLWVSKKQYLAPCTVSCRVIYLVVCILYVSKKAKKQYLAPCNVQCRVISLVFSLLFVSKKQHLTSCTVMPRHSSVLSLFSMYRRSNTWLLVLYHAASFLWGVCLSSLCGGEAIPGSLGPRLTSLFTARQIYQIQLGHDHLQIKGGIQLSRS
jgi:hypothetical protein